MGAAHGGVNCIMSGGRSALCTGTLYGGEGLSSVRLGLLQGLYERFLIKDLIRYYPPTQAGLYTECTGMDPSRITSSMARLADWVT